MIKSFIIPVAGDVKIVEGFKATTTKNIFHTKSFKADSWKQK